MDQDQCFQHDDSMPVTTLRTFACEDYLESTIKNPLCELNLPKGQHAWYDESTQALNKSTFPWESAISRKKIRADCRQ